MATNPPKPRKDSLERKRQRALRRERAQRRRLRTRVLQVGAILFLLLLTALVALALGRHALLRRALKPRIEQTLGVEFTQGRFYATLDGVVSIDDPVWRAPGVPGEAGAIFSADRLTARLDFGALLAGAGAGAITDIEAIRPVIRLSQDTFTGDLNLDPIVRHTTAGAPSQPVVPGALGAVAPPALRIVDGTLEFGEHRGEQYAPLARLRVEGLLEPPNPGEPAYELILTEITDQSRPPMLLTGAIDLERSSASLTLRNLDLTNLNPAAAPSRVRDLWSRLAIEGSAPRTEFHYSPEGGVEAEFELAGVNLTTPAPIVVNPMGDRGGSPETLRMQGVDGFIRFDRDGLRADLSGRVEDVDLRVEMVTGGLDVGAEFPFDATVRIEPFFFRDGARATLFAPPEAQEIIDLFLGPQALVRGEVRIHRAAGELGNVGDLAVEGLITFEDGQMAYADFPYPVRDISGQVAFDTRGVQLRNLRGFGVSGAFVTAEGEVAGYEADAGLDIRIRAVDTPIDDILVRAMPDQWRPLIDGLIDREAYEGMRQRGVVQSEQDRDAIAARIAELAATLRDDASLRTSQRLAIERDMADLGRRLRVPVFEPGGAGSADIRITRPKGALGEFHYDIAIAVPKASLLPSRFAYPLIADPLRVTIREQAVIESDLLRGLTGGAGRGRIVVNLADRSLQPAVDVRLDDLPIDALLRDVLPAAPIALGEGLVSSPGRLLTDLGVTGTVDASLRLDPTSPDGLDAVVSFRDVEAAPAPDHPAILTDLAGEASIRGDRFRVGPVTGFVAPPRHPGAFAPEAPAALRLLVEGRFDEESPSVEAALTIDGLPLESPIERIVDVFSPEAAAGLRSLRAARDPSGRIDATVLVASHAGAPTSAEITLENGRWLAFNALGGRLTMQRPSGSAVIDLDERVARLDRFGGSLLFNMQPSGRLALDGVLALGAEGAEDLSASLEGARLESDLVRAFVRSEVDESLADAMASRRLAGMVGVEARLTRAPGAARRAAGWVAPASLGFDAGDEYVDIRRAGGRITFDPDGGRFDSLRLEGDDWRVGIDGAWTAGESPGLDVGASIDARGWPRPLVALLPAGVRQALDAIDFRIDGPWTVRDARLVVEAPGADPARSRGSATARVSVTDAAFFAGVDVERAIGGAALAVDWSPDRQRPVAEIEVGFENLRAMGLSLTDARAFLRSGDDDSLLRVEDLSADFARGRIAGAITVRAEADTPRYDADLRLGGVDLGALIGAIGADTGTPEGPTPERGLVSGQLFLTGRLRDPDSRIGRGVLVAEQGDLIDLPFIVGVIELTNLQPPRNEDLDYGVVEFSLEQQRVSIERLAAESASLRVEGEGRLNLADGTVDLIFTSRGKRRLPLLSNIFDALRNELIAARVTGTLREPRFRAQPLPSAGRVLEGSLGAARSEAGMVGDSPRGPRGRDRTTPTVPLQR